MSSIIHSYQLFTLGHFHRHQQDQIFPCLNNPEYNQTVKVRAFLGQGQDVKVKVKMFKPSDQNI